METKTLFKKRLSQLTIRKIIYSFIKKHTNLNISEEKIDFFNLSLENMIASIIVFKNSSENLGTNKFRRKKWSILIFNFIEENDYLNLFGTNRNRKDISENIYKPEYDFSSFEFDESKNEYTGKNPDDLYINKKIKHLIQQYVYKQLYDKAPYLFTSTYVYSIVGIVNERNIKNFDNYFTYFFDTTYKFNSYDNSFAGDLKNQCISLNPLVEIKNIRDGYNDLKDLVEAYLGQLNFNEITEKNYLDIKSDIDNKTNYIITTGMARTGKTVIAMRILGEYIDSNFIILNKNFYNSLKDIFGAMKERFPANKITYNNYNEDEKFVEMMEHSSILIIDEAQRLNEGHSELIVNKNSKNINIILGDDCQKINYKQDHGIAKIKELIENNNSSYRLHEFKESIGLPINVVNSIKYLIYRNTKIDECSLNKYKINIFKEDEKIKFIEKFNNDESKKHMSTISVDYDSWYTAIEGFERLKKIKSKYFLDQEIVSKYILSPYELISRELDSIYIYLPNMVQFTEEEGIIYSTKKSLNEYLLNQIYVLMTRAKIGCNIYCEDANLYNYFCDKCKLLNNLENKEK